MWKLILLQFILALLPVFIFQFWYDYSKPFKRVPYLLILFCGACVTLGIAVCAEVKGFDLDYLYAQLIIGSLYGGPWVTLALTAIYLFAEQFMMDGSWGWIEMAGTVLFVIPIISMFNQRFYLVERRKKYLIVFGLTAVVLLIRFCALINFNYAQHPDMRFADYAAIAIHQLGYFVIMGLAIFFSEHFVQHQHVNYELHKISNSFRIEVQKLQQFIEETPLGVIFVDQEGTITHINEMAILLLKDKVGGRQRQDLIGQPFTILYDHIEKDVMGRLLYQALNGHKITTEYVQEQGKIFVNSGICVRDIQNNEIIGAAIIAHDITELNRLRDEVGRMERLSLVGQMAASITHEIRNPMAVIRGFVQLMRERSPDNQKEYYRIVMEELDRANSIISDFLSLAQNRVIEKNSQSLHDIINEILPLLWADANMRGQSLELRLTDQIPMLMLNEKEMKQLILNLARNGMEAMDQHGILSLETATFENYVEMRVSDTGSGIPQEKLEHLFEPFYTTKSHGTGLGLPLCLSIMERHGGVIHVDSKEGAGTTFIVRFDRSRNAYEAAAALSRD
ncbi:ATP-binding protein [Paenibacillus sacheonensis]|uniref:histidine kinase n=1 Tax=Paenibacillus sacheonensis TaxID=742054 RepID=A0A7X5C0R4_9BACL|nr:PAS domain S-box-containing protein [Paenibacillus sacheonensis]NBC72002.1 PAS domain S-box protein [Paenibacillus sacheonensis]